MSEKRYHIYTIDPTADRIKDERTATTEAEVVAAITELAALTIKDWDEFTIEIEVEVQE